MTPQDLVPGDAVLSSRLYGVLTYPRWGSKSEGHPGQNGFLEPHEVGLVIESLAPRGGNGVRILIAGSEPRVAWVNVLDLMKL